MPQVLVIDDDDTMREMILQMLELENISGQGAQDGLVAQKLFTQHTFDLIITDIVMPEKEGIETIIYFKKLKPDIPIIAISGGAKIGPVSYLGIAQQLGARYTFTKPLNRKDFIMAVKNCLRIE